MNEKQIQEVMVLVDLYAHVCAFVGDDTMPRTRSAIESALREQVREVPEGWVAVERGALNMVINALRRDAEQGRPVRGEMADALSAAPTQPPAREQVPEHDDQILFECGKAAGREEMKQELSSGLRVSDKYRFVLEPFAAVMDAELHANSAKGDRPGWLSMSREVALLEIYWHTAKLSAAVKNNDAALIREHSADVANMAMMLLDVCGGLLSAAPTHPAAQEVPEDPMDWPLPCDVKVGHGTIGKGCTLGTLVTRMKVLYEMATGNNADAVANRTDAERQALACQFRAALAAPAQPAQAEQPKKSDCTECANADSWGLPDKAFCAGCYGGSHWSPLNRSSVNPNVKVSQPKAAQQEPVGSVYRNSVTGEFELLDYKFVDQPPGTHADIYTAAPQREPMNLAEAVAGILEQIADEPPINGNSYASARVLMKANEIRMHGITKKEQQ